MRQTLLNYFLPKNCKGRPALGKRIEFNLVWLGVLICLRSLFMEVAQAQVPQAEVPQVQVVQVAQVQEQAEDTDGWHFRVGIPLWAAGTTGTIGVRNREVHIDKSFSDLADTLDFTAALNLEIRKRRWLFFSDGLYLKTSTSGDPRGLFSGAQVHVGQKMAFDDLAIGYAVVKNECFSLEPFVGAQLVYLEPNLSLDLPITNRTASTSRFWADPILGIYLNYRFSKPAGFYAKADVGGFGVSSHLTYQAEGGFDFPIASHFYARLAYRYLNIDFEKRNASFEFATSGPQLELGLRF